MRKLASLVALAAAAVVALLIWGQGESRSVPLIEASGASQAEEAPPAPPVLATVGSEASATRTSTAGAPGEPETPLASPAGTDGATSNESILPQGECGFRVLWVGADPRGVEATIERAQGPFMGGDFRLDHSLTRPLEPSSGLSGEVEFKGLASGHWSIGLVEPSGRHWRSYVKAMESDALLEVMLVHGPCSVEGTAWSDDGAPWPDLMVQLSIESRDKETGRKSLWRSWTRTDERGQYLLDGWEPGGGWMSVAPSDDLSVGMGDPGILMSEAFGFRADERRIVNFGSPLGRVGVHLTLSDASGRRLRDGQVILVSAQEGGASTSDLRDTRSDIAEDGTATLRCAPGTYQVEVRGWDGLRGNIAEIDVIGPGDLELDLSLKGGHTIHGTVVGTDGEPQKGKTREFGLALRPEPSPRSGVLRFAPLRPDGSFSFYTVEPGDYYLTTESSDTFHHMVVNLPAGDPVAVDVVLQVEQQ